VVPRFFAILFYLNKSEVFYEYPGPRASGTQAVRRGKNLFNDRSSFCCLFSFDARLGFRAFVYGSIFPFIPTKYRGRQNAVVSSVRAAASGTGGEVRRNMCFVSYHTCFPLRFRFGQYLGSALALFSPTKPAFGPDVIFYSMFLFGFGCLGRYNAILFCLGAEKSKPAMIIFFTGILFYSEIPVYFDNFSGLKMPRLCFLRFFMIFALSYEVLC
jgi:hypothetical protein